MGKLINANSSELQDIISSESGIVLVDFWAAWCGPCRVLGPTLEDLSNEVEDVTIVKVDVDKNPEPAAQYGVRGIPTVFVFRGGEQVDKFVGALGKGQILQVIERNRVSGETGSEEKTNESQN